LDSKLPNWIDKNVSSRIRARRRELKLSQDMLAERLGVTFQQIQKYERGANRVSAGRLFELARALDTTIMYFYEGLSDLKALNARGVAEAGADFAQVAPDVAELVAAFERIENPDQRKNVLATVRKAAAAARKSRGGSRGES
jgi:transcriptional regulator with XRE-family HTH domain